MTNIVVYYRASEDDDIPVIYGPFDTWQLAKEFCLAQRELWLSESPGFSAEPENPDQKDVFNVTFDDEPDEPCHTYWLIGELRDPVGATPD